MMCTERLPIVKKNLCMVLNECHFYVDVTCQMHLSQDRDNNASLESIDICGA